MAFNNLLNGSFRGAVGTMVGEKWKNKKTVHTRVFSKSPPTEKQTKNVRAFECLNRLASAMANKFYPWLGLTNKEMYPHNAVARWLKPLIETHTFNPGVIQDIIEKDGSAVIDEFEYNRATGRFKCKASTTIDPRDGSNESWLLTVLDTEGRVWYCESPKTRVVEFEREIVIPKYQSLCAFTMISKKVDGKFKLSGLYYDELPPQYDCHLIVENVTLDDANSQVIISGHSEEEVPDFETTVIVKGVGISLMRNVNYTAETDFTMRTDGTFTQVLQIPVNEYGDRYYFRKWNSNTAEETQVLKGKAVIVISRYSFNIRDINKTYTFRGNLPSFVRSERTFTLSNTGWFADGLEGACEVRHDDIGFDGKPSVASADMVGSLESQGLSLTFTVSADCRGNGNFYTNDGNMLKLYVLGEDGKAVWNVETTSNRFSFPYWDNPLDFYLSDSNISTSERTGAQSTAWFPDIYKGKLYWKSLPDASCSFVTPYWNSSGWAIANIVHYNASGRSLYIEGGGRVAPGRTAMDRLEFAPIHATGYVNAVSLNGVTVRLRYVVGSSKIVWTVV